MIRRFLRFPTARTPSLLILAFAFDNPVSGSIVCTEARRRVGLHIAVCTLLYRFLKAPDGLPIQKEACAGAPAPPRWNARSARVSGCRFRTVLGLERPHSIFSHIQWRRTREIVRPLSKPLPAPASSFYEAAALFLKMIRKESLNE
jgi:hypothetical protein